MAGNLNDLATRLRQRAKDLPEKVNRLAVKVTTTIVNDLAHVTPVDTSQAISNWQVGIGEAPGGNISPHFPGRHGSTYGPSSQQTIEEALAILKGKRPGQVIYLSNGLLYITRLNEGSSAQAPAGFVERGVLLGRLVIAKTKVLSD